MRQDVERIKVAQRDVVNVHGERGAPLEPFVCGGTPRAVGNTARRR